METKIFTQVIAIFDNEQEQQEIVGFLAADFQVDIANNFESAYKLLARKHVDVIVSNWTINNCSGLQLLQNIRQLYPRLPVLFCYTQITAEETLSAIEFEVSKFLKKPLQKNSLVSAIHHNLLKVRSYFSTEKTLYFKAENYFRATLESRDEAIYNVLDAIDNIFTIIYPTKRESLAEFKIALYEAFINALEHGSTSQKDIILFALEMKNDRIIAHIKDQGGGFDYQSYQPDLHIQKNHFQHGIDFMKHLLDDLSFNHIGNEVHLLKIL